MSYIIKTLVGGPCDGQVIPKSLFDGRPEILVFKLEPATLLNEFNVMPDNKAIDLYRYTLREARSPYDRSVFSFAYIDVPDADALEAVKWLPRWPVPFDEQ